MSKKRRHWTRRETDLVREMLDDGMTVKDMLAYLPGRTEIAITTKVHDVKFGSTDRGGYRAPNQPPYARGLPIGSAAWADACNEAFVEAMSNVYVKQW